MKRTSRYPELLQRVPFAESGCKERYFEKSKLLRESNNASELHTDYIAIWGGVEIMMGAPITAQEYR